MSVTTTANPITRTSLSVLADYELHHSGSDGQEQQQAPAPNTQPSPSSQSQALQPANWSTHHRRVPAYRPVNRNLDPNERSAGSNAGEYVFIQVMLHGVWLNASVARLWRYTGGRINDRVFRHEVGGEY